MKAKRFWRCLAMATVFIVMLTATVAAAPAAQESTTTQAQGAVLDAGKQEVVYANLAADGSVDGMYVVNEFQVQSGGVLTDYGDYTQLKNLSTEAEIRQDGDCVSVDVSPGAFYYQGTLENKALPWDFSIDYRMDGQPMSAAQIAGKSGTLQIHVQSSRNEDVDPTFAEYYMLQISVTLDAQTCTKIDAPEATIANAGTDKVLTYTVLPSKDADFTIEAQVEDFAMDGISINASPFSLPIELPDTDGLTQEMMPLCDAISTLNSGAAALYGGASALSSGMQQLVGGSASYAQGLRTLAANTGSIKQGSDQIKQGLEQIASRLQGLDDLPDFDEKQIQMLLSLLRAAAQGIDNTASALNQLQQQHAAAVQVLDAAIGGIDTLSDADLALIAQMMQDAQDAQKAALSNLLAVYQQAQIVKQTYTQADSQTNVSIQTLLLMTSTALDTIVNGDGTQENPGISSVGTMLNLLADTLEDTLSDLDLSQLQLLAQGIRTLAEQYATFDAGLDQCMDGIAQLSDNYGALHDGLSQSADGAAQLAGGVQRFSSGTAALDTATSALPETIQVQIDELLADFDLGDFEAVSFVSTQNENTDYVQFIVMTQSIAPQQESDVQQEQEEQLTIWQRFLALFS